MTDSTSRSHNACQQGANCRLAVLSAIATLVFAGLPAGCALRNTVADANRPAPKYAEYEGYYASGPLSVARIFAVDDVLAAQPPFWTAKPYFERAEGETFGMTLPSPRPHRTITFERSPGGDIVAFTLANMDERNDARRFRRLAAEAAPPALLFLQGQPERAARAALADAALSADDLANYGERLLWRYPSRHKDTATFLEIASEAHPGDARVRGLHAYALVAIGRRADALATARAALAIDPSEQNARAIARRLTFDEPSGAGYRKHLPFTLRAAFALPSEAEIADAKAAVAARDLSPQNVALVATHVAKIDGVEFEVRILSHRVHGSIHFGAVFVTRDAGEMPLPVVLDARGVNPTYSPMSIAEGTDVYKALGAARREFVFLVPSFRGNTLIFADKKYVSEGDPSDAWDGATDDAIAFLSAALSVTPEADAKKIAIYGHSRGGSVAVLAGARDDRISLVLNVAGPLDHFVAQDQHVGWASWEVIADAMRDGEIPAPTVDGGQDFDHFLDRVVDQGETLQQVRRRMIASSPVYFLATAPETHSWYGAEDTSVPIANARLLKAEGDRLGWQAPRYTVAVFDGLGHDTDPYEAQRATTDYLKAWGERAMRSVSRPPKEQE
jgi:hypothetical protein